ncbi:MAG: HK97 family phage prohead protease [Acidimicrobiales bacterium]
MTTTLDRLEQGYRDDLTADVHDVDDRRHQVAVDFPADGPPDKFGTSWGSGCFAASFRHQLPPMLVEHDRNRLVGHAISGQSVGRVHRLIGQFSDFDDVPEARQTFAHIRDGDYPGWSFWFTDGATEPHPTVRSARRFTKATMKEFGPTVAPAIDGVLVSGLRSAGGSRADDVEPLDLLAQLRDLLAKAKADPTAKPEHIAVLKLAILDFARHLHLQKLGAKNDSKEMAADLADRYGSALDAAGSRSAMLAALEMGFHHAAMDANALRRERDPAFRTAEVADRAHRTADEIRRMAALRLGSGSSGRRSYSPAVVGRAWIKSLERSDRRNLIAAALATIDRRGPRGPGGNAA